MLVGLIFASSAALPGCLGCGSGCPTSVDAEERSKWEAQLAKRQLIPLDANDDISIKRDVHEIFVDVDAATFANAFHQIMMDPDRRFGLIRVDRLAANTGQPFQLGEKFQGRYSVEGAVAKELPDKWRRLFGDLVDDDEIQDILCKIENKQTSDFGVISKLDLSPPAGKPHILEYQYLEGSPIAGGSTFIVTEASADDLARLGVSTAAKVTKVFLYQEQSSSFAKFFTKGGLKLHNQVVLSQAKQSAALAGGKIIETDIPPEYENL